MADIAKGLELLSAGPRRLTWVCGIPALVAEYVDAFKAACGSVDYVWLEKAEHIGDVLATERTKDAGLVVFGAGCLTDEQAAVIEGYGTSRRVTTPVLFVDDAPGWRTQKVGKYEEQMTNPALRAVFVNARKSSVLVEARLADTDKGQENARDIVRKWLPEGTRSAARVLCEAVEYDMSHAREVCMKARALGTSNEQVLKVLARREAHSGYVESLTMCDKAVAALEAQHVPHSAYGGIIARLDYTLDVMARIHRTLKHAESTHALATRMGIHRVVVGKFRPYARHYTGRDVARRTAVLVWADEQIRAGRRAGVLEMVAAQW